MAFEFEVGQNYLQLERELQSAIANGKEEKLAGKKTKANLQVKRNKKNKPKEIKIKQIKRDKTK